MLHFHPELFKLASEEQRRRLLAEAAQWRMRQGSPAARPHVQARER
jgi:hypothetical protein